MFNILQDVLGFFGGISGSQNRAAQGNAVHARFHQCRDVLFCDTTDGNQWQRNAFFSCRPRFGDTLPNRESGRAFLSLCKNGTGRNRCNPLPRAACNITSSNVLAVPPMMRSCPKSLRASSMGMSLFPGWMPSACKTSTHSTWSSKMKVAPYRRHRASTSAPVRIHSSAMRPSSGVESNGNRLPVPGVRHRRNRTVPCNV